MHSSTKSTHLTDTAVVPGLHFRVVRVTGQKSPRGHISIWQGPFVPHHISPLQVCLPPATVPKATYTLGGGVPRRMCPCCASLVYTCPSYPSLITIEIPLSPPVTTLHNKCGQAVCVLHAGSHPPNTWNVLQPCMAAS
jgi:hypothetical protein